MPEPIGSCPLCNKTSTKRESGDDETTWPCPRCGQFSVTGTAEAALSSLPLADKTRLSWLTRRQHDSGRSVKFSSGNLQPLLRSAPRIESPLDSLDELLKFVASRFVSLDQPVRLDSEKDYPAILTKSNAEMGHVLGLAISEPLKWLRRAGNEGFAVQLTTEGWRQVIELRRKKPRADEAFIAMSFHPSLKDAYDQGIKPALEETGYRPIRVDREEHNAKIDDEIIARIRASSLVVADFTLQRTGVYFEAGFALGLGLPVIWTCRTDDSMNLQEHFDTRQYNHILWENPGDLKTRLRNRINATVPQRQANR